MTLLPSDLTDHVGQEVTLRGVFRAARLARRTYFWRALVCLLLALVILAASVGAVMTAGQFLFAVAVEKEAATAAVATALLSLLATLGVLAAVASPLWTGYVWSVVSAYDGRRPRPRDLFHGFRTRWGALTLVGLLRWLSYIGVHMVMWAVMCCLLGYIVAAAMHGPGPTGGWIGFAVAYLVGLGVSLIGLGIVRLFFFLGSLFAAADARASAVTCLRYNWRVFKARRGSFILVALLPYAVGLVLSLAWLPLMFVALWLADWSVHTEPSEEIYWIAATPFGIAYICLVLWFMVYYTFLKAAFFRAAYGYTLEMTGGRTEPTHTPTPTEPPPEEDAGSPGGGPPSDEGAPSAPLPDEGASNEPASPGGAPGGR